ncbi:hypothetical protein JTE90_006047 [Oedothorax gibbosus]|uniref:Uncharacterized protein n=1 Tax=Oedothorax gibbosus TaxID=931172 RepID=A0AAV6V3T7_9ARAC|nr:hypothetical protein JTE90_006047 [Oedothorax gibbosus]
MTLYDKSPKENKLSKVSKRKTPDTAAGRKLLNSGTTLLEISRCESRYSRPHYRHSFDASASSRDHNVTEEK